MTTGKVIHFKISIYDFIENKIMHTSFSDIIFSNAFVQNAITTLKKIEFFISDCNEYICGKLDGGNVNSAELLKVSGLHKIYLKYG